MKQHKIIIHNIKLIQSAMRIEHTLLCYTNTMLQMGIPVH